MNFIEPGLYEKAVLLCVDAHFKDRRRFSAEPYSNHPMAVARSLRDFDIEYQIVALLHDLIEDTDFKLEALYDMGFTKDIVEAIEFASVDLDHEMAHPKSPNGHLFEAMLVQNEPFDLLRLILAHHFLRVASSYPQEVYPVHYINRNPG